MKKIALTKEESVRFYQIGISEGVCLCGGYDWDMKPLSEERMKRSSRLADIMLRWQEKQPALNETETIEDVESIITECEIEADDLDIACLKKIFEQAVHDGEEYLNRTHDQLFIQEQYMTKQVLTKLKKIC